MDRLSNSIEGSSGKELEVNALLERLRGNQANSNRSVGQKTPAGLRALLYPRPPLRSLTKVMGTSKANPPGDPEQRRLLVTGGLPPITSEPARRIGLGSPPGRDPLRINFTLRQGGRRSRVWLLS